MRQWTIDIIPLCVCVGGGWGGDVVSRLLIVSK